MSNMYFKAKVSEVAVHKRKPFDEGFTGGEREGTIVDIQELINLVGGKLAGGVHAWSMATHTASVKFIVWRVSHGKYFDISLSPSRLERFSRR